MKYCPNCGSELSENSQFCPSCGKNLREENLQSNHIQSESTRSTNMESKQKTNNALPFIIIGWISVGFSLIFIPILFGALSVIMGFLVKKRGKDTHGVIIMIVGVAAALFGVLIGAIIGASNPAYY